MIRAHRSRLTWVAAALASLTVAATGCDFNDPDEIQNQANMALVRVQVFASSDSRTPVSGVRMVVESPPPDQGGGGGGAQQRRYQGPDVIGTSGEDGIAEAFVFPGYDIETLEELPTDPFTLPAPLFFADVRVVFIYNGQVLPFLDGLTIGSGRLYDLGSVFLLDDFGIVVD